MALARPFLLLLVIFVGFSYIVSSNATPTTRTRSLLHGHLSSNQLPKVERFDLDTKETKKLIKGRMDIELEDYPGSGPNNRHTPRAESTRG